jgi:hypothetical protein
MPSASPKPHDVIKAPDPDALSGTISASPNPCDISMGAPGPLGVLLPHLRGTWSHRDPTTTPNPVDGMDMTVHSE